MLGAMAMLRHTKTKKLRPVPARLLVGRSPACALRLGEACVSGEHATLIWSMDRWEVRDLGSRNGTWVDGRRLAAGEAATVQAGGALGFGDPEDRWELVEAGPPSAIAEELRGGALRPAQDGILALPDDEHPELLVYADASGRWLVEATDQPPRAVEDEAVVTAGGGTWRLRLPERQVGTAAMHVGATLDTVRLRFAVSRDEEHVQVTVAARAGDTVLEVREHWYTLLTLARLRLEDAGEPASEQGWIERDDLLKMLGIDANALNVAIYRARRQLQASGIDGAAGLVEVRRGQRRIGVPADHLEVVPL
jgi:hypothetical protein